MTATSKSKNPSHHLELSGAGGKLRFLLVDAAGKIVTPGEKPFPISIFPLEAQGLQTFEGAGNYDTKKWPYMTIAQQDWSGGRGMEIFEDDKTRYFDGWRVDSTKESKLFMGGVETYSLSGIRKNDFPLNGSLETANSLKDITFLALYGATRYRAGKFDASASYNCGGANTILRKVGSPGTPTVSLYSYSAGYPNAALKTNLVTISTSDTLSINFKHIWASVQALVSGTAYFIVVAGAATDDDANHWEVGCVANTGGEGCTSADGTTWTLATSLPWFRMFDDTEDMDGFFLDYKQAKYFVTQPNYGNSILYLCGDRGTADDNTGNKNYLNDATKSWTADEFAGCKVHITKGPGSEESEPYRNILSNTATGLNVSPAWNVVHTIATEYVIVKEDKWRSTKDLGGYVTDAAVAGEYIYFARGGDTAILRYQAYTNSSGVWTDRSTNDGFNANRLLAIHHPEDDTYQLYGSLNSHAYYGTCVWWGNVPYSWESLYTEISTLAATDSPWDAWEVANVTRTSTGGATKIAVADAFTTGVVAVENITATDITKGKYLAAQIYSSKAKDDAHLQLLYDDQPNLGGTYTPTSLTHTNNATPLEHTAMSAAIDGDAATAYDLATWNNDTYTYASLNVKFNKITVDLGATVNAVASVMTAQYYNGYLWTALTITDGTISTSGKTLSGDGSITFSAPYDWQTCTIGTVTGYFVRLKVSVNLTANILFNEVTLERKNNVTLNVPALAAGAWTWVTMAITPDATPLPDETSIQSIGLKVAVEETEGAFDVYMLGGIKVLGNDVSYKRLLGETSILGMVAYSGNTTDPRENPWIRTPERWYELQTQSDNALVALPIGEMKELAESTSNFAAATNDVNLWFSLNRLVEQYYSRNLQDTGPNKDAGLPSNRRGRPSFLLSFPGRVYLGLDGDTTNYSSILVWKTNGWHEVYRSAVVGQRIRAAMHQPIPGSDTGKLWFLDGADLKWIPVSLNPLNDSDYYYTYESALETGWVTANMRALLKIFNIMNVFLDNASTDGSAERFIAIDYKVDDDTAWTEVDGECVSPQTSLELASTPETAYRIKFRFRFYTNDASLSPIMSAWALEAFGVDDTKYGYRFTALLADEDADVKNLEQEKDRALGSAQTVEGAIATLKNWITAGTLLSMNSIWSLIPMNVGFVKMAPFALRPADVSPKSQTEKHLLEITLFEI